MGEQQEYEVTEARQINGQWRSIGEVVHMSPRLAQYYLPPHGAGLKQTAVEDPAPGEAKATGKRTRKTKP